MRIILALLCAGMLLAANESDYLPSDSRAMLGIEMSPPSAQTQSREGLDPSQGVEVQHVYPGTAADRMGIKPGDVILGINGGDINSMTDLRNEVALAGVGGNVDLVVSRGGQRSSNPGTLGEWPKSIPYTPIDDAAERRFRDWQKRRLDRTEQAIANLDKQLKGMELPQAKFDKTGNGGGAGTLSPAAAMALPASEGLAGLPAWRLRLQAREATVPPKTLAPTIPKTADVPGSWDLRVLTGSPQPEVL